MARFRYEPPIYTFRVRIRGGFYAPAGARSVWREIEVASNQTLYDLGELIPLAFDFDDPHLWAFYLSGKAWDRATEYAVVDPESGPDGFNLFGPNPEAGAAGRIRIRDVPLPGTTGKKEFLFLFDYGDEWHFGVKLVRTSDTVEPRVEYPRVVASQGDPPAQYPQLDDEYEEDDA